MRFFRITVVIKLYYIIVFYNYTCSEEKCWHLEKAEMQDAQDVKILRGLSKRDRGERMGELKYK